MTRFFVVGEYKGQQRVLGHQNGRPIMLASSQPSRDGNPLHFDSLEQGVAAACGVAGRYALADVRAIPEGELRV